jgi:hypothetical protein
LRLEQLPPGVTLQLYSRPQAGAGLGSPLFSSSGHWLHPLFELEEYLAAHPGAGFFLRDRVVGSAAAFLILHLGISEVEADVASHRALQLLRERGVAAEARVLVEAIGCATEQLLQDESEPEAAYRMLSERRERALRA